MLYLVSLGPGSPDLVPPLATSALEASSDIVGYELYFGWIRSTIKGKRIHSLPLTQEKDRAILAIDLAREGKDVSLVSSGDIGIYAMATLVFELMKDTEPFELEVIPGITSATACAALLGAPLSHDFATLSLSDLLCPWDWIELRADHIAQADLACVLYNVQSKSRQEGVYRIIDLFLKHKPPNTLCGIIRNAYRKAQTLRIKTLSELKSLKFDMLTSILIGNRFTRRKGDYIYTPRGYLGWKKETQNENVPKGLVWVFSGTKDGNQLAEKLQKNGVNVMISTATKYGYNFVKETFPQVASIQGNLGNSKRKELLLTSEAKYILDATHPFSTCISKKLMSLSLECRIPYVRYEREKIEIPDGVIQCASILEAGKKAKGLGKRIFLGTGSNDLHIYLHLENQSSILWFIRVPPDPGLIRKVAEQGISNQNICAMQGPFSEEGNIQLWKQWKIDCVISKDSGIGSGFKEKIQACEKLKIPLVLIQRPQIKYADTMSNFYDLMKKLSI